MDAPPLSARYSQIFLRPQNALYFRHLPRATIHHPGGGRQARARRGRRLGGPGEVPDVPCEGRDGRWAREGV